MCMHLYVSVYAQSRKLTHLYLYMCMHMYLDTSVCVCGDLGEFGAIMWGPDALIENTCIGAIGGGRAVEDRCIGAM